MNKPLSSLIIKEGFLKDHSISHPWKLIGYKAFYFSILYIIYKLPISHKDKIKWQKRLFYDKFARFARDEFRVHSNQGKNENLFVYNLGPFKICINSNSTHFQINYLEWNLAYQYFDIIYPALNSNHFKLILGEGPYEISDVFCEKGEYVIDAGANFGIFTFLSSIKVGDNGHVFAIEPIDFFAKCLEESLNINSLNNISILRVALGRENKEDIINLDRENPMNSGKLAKSSHSLAVRYVKLDSLVFDGKIPKVDFLKMDIEGSERDALLGGREVIFKFKPKLSICTYHLKDDPIVLRDIIKNINPNYKIEMGRKKLYARI